MKELAIRLTENADLKASVKEIQKTCSITAGVVLSAVGCLKAVNIRLAEAKDYLCEEKDYEIVSLMGTICPDGLHLHISLSDNTGKVIGGHLEEGCIINTTCELVIGILEDYQFKREYDEATGYKELIIKNFDIIF